MVYCLTAIALSLVFNESSGEQVMSKIFILYRPGESDEASIAIHKALSERFGNKCFLLGSDPAQYQTAGLNAQNIIEARSVFLVVIGPHWLASADQHGDQQVFEPIDPIRQILSRTLTTPQTLVMPVIVEGAAMPASQDLPPDLAQLVYRNAATVRRGVALDQDIDRIFRSIRAFWPLRKRFSYPRFAYAQIFVTIGVILLGVLLQAINGSFTGELPDFLLRISILFAISVGLWFLGIWLATVILTIRLRRWGWFIFELLLALFLIFVFFGPVMRKLAVLGIVFELGIPLIFALFGPVSKPVREARKA